MSTCIGTMSTTSTNIVLKSLPVNHTAIGTNTLQFCIHIRTILMHTIATTIEKLVTDEHLHFGLIAIFFSNLDGLYVAVSPVMTLSVLLSSLLGLRFFPSNKQE